MKMKNKKGFTFIELLVVIAILGILVLLGGPRLLDYVQKAEVAHITHDVKISEDALMIYLSNDNNKLEDFDLKEIPVNSKVYDKKGLYTKNVDGPLYDVTRNIKSNLDGTFLANENNKVYYAEENRDGGGENEEAAPPETDPNLFTWERLNDSDEMTGTGPFRVTGYLGTAVDIVIPNRYQGEAVLEIGDEAFPMKNLNSAYIPDGVTRIGYQAFVDNVMTSVRIPESVVFIGEHSFNSNQLTSLSIPGDNVVIESSSFFGNPLETLTLSGSVAKIGNSVFNGGNIKSLHITGNNAVIQNAAFLHNPIEKLTFSGTFAQLERSSFHGNKLKTVFLPEGVQQVDENAFYENPGLVLQGVPGGVAYTFKSTEYPAPRFEPVNSDGSSLKPAGEPDSFDFVWEYVSDVPGPVRIIEYLGSDLDVVIPDTIYGQTVVALNYGNSGPPFSYTGELASVYVPESLTSIPSYFFIGNAEGFVLKGLSGSAAEKYATDNGIDFEVVSK